MRASIPLLLISLGCRTTDDKRVADDTGGGTTDVDEDVDGDGVPASEDCDDADASVSPEQAEIPYNGADDDCDPATPDDDLDGDGHLRSVDCDDTDPDIRPGASESCNGVDDDCDGEVDETGGSGWYADVDGDGRGDPDAPSSACAPGDALVDNADDCDDTDADTYPGAPESCDERDNDCDGEVDEDVETTWYADVDADGWGDAAAPLDACTTPVGYAAAAGDCDDGDATVSPAATEVCDGVDNDCDGATDEDDAADATGWFEDADADGYGDPAATVVACAAPAGHVDNADDCDDTDAAVSPDTSWAIDYDGDGYGSTAYTLASCLQPSGYVLDTSDCDDTDAGINPGAAEVCNDEDDDCDGLTDDDDPDGPGSLTFHADTDGDGYGDAATTHVACAASPGWVSDDTDCDDTDASISPAGVETCDGVDEDCDGIADDGLLGSGAACPAETCADVLADQPGATDGTFSLDPDGDGTADDFSCDMTTDGGGWTGVFDWDRANDGDSLTDFEALFTEDVNNMSDWTGGSGFIRWSDYNSTADVMSYSTVVDIPNGGEALLDVRYSAYSHEDSAVFFSGETSGGLEEIWCAAYWDWNSSGLSAWTASERSWLPYTCSRSYSGQSASYDHTTVDQVALSDEIIGFELTSFHYDGSYGDTSKLYWIELWVR